MKDVEALAHMTQVVDDALMGTFASRAQGPAAKMYHMMEYFMGYRDVNLERSMGGGGKRFRPSLCLFIAEAYGSRESAMEAAVAIELFHNLTLLHDDIEDRDEYRRGRPTVWKLWGINNAINAGDIQSLLVTEWIARAQECPHVGVGLAQALTDAFIEVWEGQYLDFELAENAIESGYVTREAYLTMIEKKSGALVRIATEAAGIAHNREEERPKLREYGASLGMAYQIADDYRSVWSTQEETGKDRYGDIREHKRTLPFLYAHKESSHDTKGRLAELYSLTRQLTEEEILEALSIINATSAHASVVETMQHYVDRAKYAARTLHISQEARDTLEAIVDALVPCVEPSLQGEPGKVGMPVAL